MLIARNIERLLRPGVTGNFPDALYHISTPGVIYKNLIIAGAQGKEDDPDGPAMAT